jgi:hypothetical protein
MRFAIKTSFLTSTSRSQLETACLHIIQQFEDLIGLSNRCGAPDGTHIPLVERSNKRYTIATTDYYNQKRFHSIVLQAVCDIQKLF